MLSPLKLATPATATFVNVPLNTPPGPALVPMATVTVEVSVVTVLPLASCTVTTGCVPQAVPPVPPVVGVVNASFTAAPGANTMFPLVTAVKVTPPDAVAVNVIVSDLEYTGVAIVTLLAPIPMLPVSVPLNVPAPVALLKV